MSSSNACDAAPECGFTRVQFAEFFYERGMGRVGPVIADLTVRYTAFSKMGRSIAIAFGAAVLQRIKDHGAASKGCRQGVIGLQRIDGGGILRTDSVRA